jgi:hypothetical protein
MCHRLLFGTPGTMANVPIATNGTYHNVIKKTHFEENKILIF